MFKIKIEAFTLFESVVAITIISVCLGIGSLVYSNIVNSEKTVVNFESNSQAKELFEDLKLSKLYSSKNYQFKSFEINQEVNDYQGIKNLYQITLIETKGKSSGYPRRIFQIFSRI